MATETKSIALEELRQQVEALGSDEKQRSKLLINEWCRLKETEKEMLDAEESGRLRKAKAEERRGFVKLNKKRGFAEPKLRKEGKRWNWRNLEV